MPYNAPVTKDIFLGMRLEPEESAALKAAAKADKRTMSAMARKLITDGLEAGGWLPQEGPKLGPKPSDGL